MSSHQIIIFRSQKDAAVESLRHGTARVTKVRVRVTYPALDGDVIRAVYLSSFEAWAVMLNGSNRKDVHLDATLTLDEAE